MARTDQAANIFYHLSSLNVISDASQATVLNRRFCQDQSGTRSSLATQTFLCRLGIPTKLQVAFFCAVPARQRSGESSHKPPRTSWRLWASFWAPWTSLRWGEPREVTGQGLNCASKWTAAISSLGSRNTNGGALRSKYISTAWPYEAIDTFVMLENWIIMIL